MKGPEVVLIGYYGRRNFGDDVLMTVTHAIARRILPGASIGVRLGTDASYPSRLVGEKVTKVPFGTRDKHRVIIHGGGGTFFDFGTHPLSARFVNSVLLSAGAQTFVQSENAVRWATSRPRMSAQTRIGLGLGVGTFTPGSRKLLEALPLLADFDHLWVRDPGSKRNLERLSVGPIPTVGSDLAFLSKDWCPPDLELKRSSKTGARPKLGVILRDWPVGSGSHFGDGFRSVMASLSEKYDLTLISFDTTTDAGTLRAFQDFPHQVWEPELTDFATFSLMLSDHDVLLTSRAHGAICGACLGRPSVILEIEPKLSAVHAMLPNSTRLARPGSDASLIASRIEEALSISVDSIAEDVIRNRNLSENALLSIMEGASL